jgi:hypothetical protein
MHPNVIGYTGRTLQGGIVAAGVGRAGIFIVFAPVVGKAVVETDFTNIAVEVGGIYPDITKLVIQFIIFPKIFSFP